MSMFWCARCDNLSDSDDSCEALADGTSLVCANCLCDDYEEIEAAYAEEEDR